MNAPETARRFLDPTRIAMAASFNVKRYPKKTAKIKLEPKKNLVPPVLIVLPSGCVGTRTRAQRRGCRIRAREIALAALLVHLAVPVHAQTGTALINETFSNATVPDANFSVQGRTCLTGATTSPPPGSANIPPCPVMQNGPVPPRGVTPGYLQFTDATNNRAGSILYNRPIPSSAGIIASFEQWQYGGTAADGIAFFLVNGGTTLTTTGGLGGSLGYAQHFAEPGVVQGYLGIGFDSFGNFYNDGENRGTGCAMQPPFLPNQNTLVKDVITLRGPGNGATGYCWLGSTTTMTTPPVSNLGGSLRAGTLAAARRSIQLMISPAPSPRVTVSIDFFDGRGPLTVLDIPAPPNPPATYKLGWSGSTGAQNDVHLIRNVVVKTVVPLNQLNLVKQIDLTNPLPNPIVVGSVIPYQFTITNTGLETLTSLALTDPSISGLTCPTDRIDPAPAPSSTVVCHGSHVITQADLDAGQFINTAVATAVAPGMLPVTSNQSTVTLPLGSTPRIKIEKFIDTPGPYSVGQSVAYRYNVTNIGTVTLNNPTVTDDKGFAVTCAPPTTLVPGGAFNSSTTCTGTYVIKDSDVNRTTGLVTNTATASATPATGGSVTSDPASRSIPVGLDIAVAKSVDNPSPILNDVVTFTITATNEGPADATGVTLSDPIGAGMTFSSASPDAGTSYDPDTGVWTIGALPAGKTVTLLLRLQVGPVTTYTNTATLMHVDQIDIDPSNDSAQSTITPRISADLDVEKTVDNPMPAVQQHVTFTVTVRNLGPSPALGVVVTDLLPAGLQFVSATPSQGMYDQTTGVWTVGTLPVAPPPNTPASLSITALVTTDGSFPNTATGTATNFPPPGDTSTVTVVASRIADLVISKNDGLTSIAAGAQETYTIFVTNLGPTDVVGATVEDMFPGELINVTWTCTAPVTGGTCGAPNGTGNIATTVDLAVGQGVTFTVTGMVDPAATGTLTNTATVKPPDGTTDPDPSNSTSTDNTTIVPSADVILTKRTATAQVGRGTDVTFTLEIVNQGPSTAVDVVVADPAPAGLTPVMPNPDPTCPSFPCSLGSLPPNASRMVTATFHIPSGYAGPDLIVNVATASSQTFDPVPGNNSGQASVTLGEDVADLSVTKDNGTTTVVAGKETTYTIVVTNNGPSDVTGVTVTDTPPATLTGVTWTCTPSAGASCSQPSGTGPIATTVSMVDGASVTFVLKGTVAPDATGQLINHVVAQNQPTVADPTPSEATDTDTITTQADLSIVKTGPQVIVPGNDLVYSLEVRNLGPSTAVNVGVTDATPTGLTFVSNGGACTTPFPCNLGNIPPDGVARIITVTFAVPLGYVLPDPISNTAVVASPTPDPDPDNNTSTAQTPLNTAADVAVTKTVTPAMATVGDDVTFTVTATNNGPNQATGVVVTDVLPAGLAFLTASPTQGAYTANLGQWTVGTLANGASVQLTLTARVTQSGVITNVATKTAANEFDPDTTNDSGTATINPQSLPADVGLQKTVNNPISPPGSDVIFTVTATNFGPGNATGVVIDDLLPAGLLFLSASPSQGTYDNVTGTWTVGSIDNGASATLSLTARVNAEGPLVNFATKTMQAEPDPKPGNDQANAVVNGPPARLISVAKSVSNAMPAVGEPVSFVVTVTNLGPEGASDVVVTDTLPFDFTLTPPPVTSQGTTGLGPGGTIIWTVPSLAPSQSAVLVLTGTIDQSGTFTNVATSEGSTGTATGNAGLVADLAITKDDGLATAFAGQVVTYTITARNLGPSPVTGALVRDTFPSILTAVTWVCAPGPGSLCQSPQGVGTIDAFVDLPAGGSAVFTASGTLSPDVAAAVSNTAMVCPPPLATGPDRDPLNCPASNVVDPNLANNTATDLTNVTLQANLAIEKTGPSEVRSGDTVTYGIVVSNLGPSTATDVVVTDPTTAGLASPVVSDPCAGGFPCNLGSLPPGARRVIAVTYLVVAQQGTVTNTAMVSSPIPDPNPDQNTSSVTSVVTGAVTTTTTTVTSSSSTSTPTTSTTTTTMSGICACTEDGGDGQTDLAGQNCCTQFGTLSISRVRITPQRGNPQTAKLRIIGTLTGAGFSDVDPRRQEVSLLLVDGTSTSVCCTIGEDRWLRLFKKHYGFWDQLERVCPPIRDVGLQQKRSGAGIVISTPHFDVTQLPGNDLTLTVRVDGSCATSTVQLRRTRSGRIVFP